MAIDSKSNSQPGGAGGGAAQGQTVQRAGNYVRETIEELKKTKWPTRQEAWRLTYVVIAVIIALGIYMGVLDYALTKIIEKLSLIK